jgi:hypothetical protein
MQPSVKVASFREAFNKFLSFIDDEISPSTLQNFATLKTEKIIRFDNETNYFDGNHSTSSSYVELILVEKPIVFYIVKYYYWETYYWETSQDSCNDTQTFIFVPNE